MTGNRELLKLKVKDGEVLVKYQRPEADATFPETITIEATEPPRQELRDAMRKMVEHMVEICELPGSWRDQLTVIGITITRNEVDGLVITALRELDGSNSPLVLNSPHFTREGVNEQQELNIYTGECAKDLDALEREAFRYVDGERMQKILEFAAEAQPAGALQ